MHIPVVLPEKRIFHRLQALLDSDLEYRRNDSIILAIEKQERKRDFCFITIHELELLFEKIPSQHRSFYECIPQTHSIKWYIDFEYLQDKNPDTDEHLALRCILVLMEWFLNASTMSVENEKLLFDRILDHFLVLKA